MTTEQMSNAVARQYFLHDHDRDHRTNKSSCYFSQNGLGDGWGFWVSPSGEVTTDSVSANGELPSQRVVDACVRAAKRHLAE